MLKKAWSMRCKQTRSTESDLRQQLPGVLTQSTDKGCCESCHAFQVGCVVQGFGYHQGCQANGVAEPSSVDAAGQEEGHVHEHAR